MSTVLSFSEVLFSKKMKKIYCFNANSNKSHNKLINNSKVLNTPKTNIRYLTLKSIPRLVNIFVCDVSIINRKKVIEYPLFF